MIPPIADGDPDPTTQIPWPSARSRPTTEEPDPIVVVGHGAMQNAPESNGKAKIMPAKRRLTTWDLVTLSISMAGAQIAWTVELGYAGAPTTIIHLTPLFSYGTPFLLGLGLSEHVTSLVWLAGPISGLIAQPVIGEVSFCELAFNTQVAPRCLV